MSMHKIVSGTPPTRVRRWVTAVAVTLLVVPAVVALTGSPAQAITCSSQGTGIWETVSWRLDTNNTALGQRTVSLELRNERISDKSAVLVTGDLYQADQIWVERLEGGVWRACAKTTVGILGGAPSRYGQYVALNLGYTMRACYEYTVYSTYRSSYCTGPYTDTD